MLKELMKWLEHYPLLKAGLLITGIFLLSIAAYGLTKKIIVGIIKGFVSKTKTRIDDLLFQEKVLNKASYIVPLLILHYFTYLIPQQKLMLARILDSAIVFVLLITLGAMLTALTEIYEQSEKYRERPIKGYVQVIKIIMYAFGTLIIIALMLGESPWALIGGLGALTAVLLLVFRDTILSFVASIQITSYDLVKVGDWIEVPKYGADGDVIDISLNVIKIQNWDKTITVIPTYKLIEDSFKNWRGMTISGGRRIKRAVNIDQTSIKFCDEAMLKKFEGIQVLRKYIKDKREEIAAFNAEKNIDGSLLVNGRRMTNIGTFRAYLKEYLKQRADINKEMTFLVRQLPSGPDGLPIEIYVFAATTKWADYEDIQSDIFDHILAVVSQFELRIFQNPSGADFQKIIND